MQSATLRLRRKGFGVSKLCLAGTPMNITTTLWRATLIALATLAAAQVFIPAAGAIIWSMTQ